MLRILGPLTTTRFPGGAPCISWSVCHAKATKSCSCSFGDICVLFFWMRKYGAASSGASLRRSRPGCAKGCAHHKGLGGYARWICQRSDSRPGEWPAAQTELRERLVCPEGRPAL